MRDTERPAPKSRQSYAIYLRKTLTSPASQVTSNSACPGKEHTRVRDIEAVAEIGETHDCIAVAYLMDLFIESKALRITEE